MNNYFFFFLFFLNLYGQRESPFENLNFIINISNNNEIYELELDKLKTDEASELDLIKKEILVATKFRDLKKIISLLNRQIEIEGESSDLLYELGGTNGIIASRKKKLFFDCLFE